MMIAFRAMFAGFGRVLGSPGLLLWMWAANLVAALPLMLAISRSLEESIGASLVHERLESGFDMGWYGEFRSGARGLETTFGPSVTGAGAFLDNLEAWFTGGLFEAPPVLLGAGALYALLWTLFVGGILHRYEGGTRGLFRLSDFLARGGEFFFRFLRLAVLSAFFYFLVYRFSLWLFGRVEEAARDVTMEKTVLGYVAVSTVLVVFLLTLVHLSFDFAKIAAFKENRRSMVLAMAKGFRLVLGNLGRTIALYYGLALLGLVLLAVYFVVGPGPGQASYLTVALAFFAGQLFLVTKIALRLALISSELALYDSPGFRR